MAAGIGVSGAIIANIVKEARSDHQAQIKREMRLAKYFTENSLEFTDDMYKNYFDTLYQIEQNFNAFRDSVKSLKERIRKVRHTKLADYLGGGVFGSVFRLPGDSYVVKFPKRSFVSLDYSQQVLAFQVKAMAMAANKISHLPRVVAYSLEEQALIMDFMPGKTLKDYTAEEISIFPTEHVDDLIKTIIGLDVHGLAIDPRPGNFLYNPQTGFSVLDYDLTENRFARPNIRDFISSVTILLTDLLACRKKTDTVDKLSQHKIYLRTAIQILEILQDKYTDIYADWLHTYSYNSLIPHLNRQELNDPEILDLLITLKRLGSELGKKRHWLDRALTWAALNMF
jgi:hypothetical protein